MHGEMPFEFEVPVSFFEKSDAPKGQQRRIGGIISTESPDRQGEIVLQKGLDFGDFLKNGWFNDNHKRDTDAIVGYPESVQFFKKGETLPNGEVATTSGHWAEGYLLEGADRADRLWKLGKSLQKTNRRLGYSVEGKIHRRIGERTILQKSADGKSRWVGNTIARATVRNVAITNCPVNTETNMEVLAKSLQAMESAEPTEVEARLSVLEKALAMGQGTNASPSGPKTGEGAGQVLATESLEDDDDPRLKGKSKALKESLHKSLTYNEAVARVRHRHPGASDTQVGRVLDLIKTLKSQGRLNKEMSR